jgi:uncharacterized radical SAM protein YgiQ
MNQFDVVFVLPYPFADHPSFPEGLLKRALERKGFSVGVLETPFWQKSESFTALGRPKLFFAVISGPVDSVVLNYTSSRKRRNEDLYQMEGKAFFKDYPPSIKYKVRPDRVVTVFSNRLKDAYKDVPIVIGGVEASLRRFSHYDFQQDKVRRSVLLDSRANILVHGMGEMQLVELAERMKGGEDIDSVDIPGTTSVRKEAPRGDGYLQLPPLEDVMERPELLLEVYLKAETARFSGKGLAQPHANRFVVDHPARQYTPQELDWIYDAPFQRVHPGVKQFSPALAMNLFSISSHRGCGGGCSFCSISLHEGKGIVSRPLDSIMREIHSLHSHPRFRGVISDIGGGSAENYGLDCSLSVDKCRRNSCLHPEVCKQLPSTQPFLQMLREARRQKGVKQVLLGSGLRYDMLLRHPVLLEEILRHHSGRYLRVAPEHTSDRVSDLMRKPKFEVFREFVRLFQSINRTLKRKIQLAPYLVVGHPGETWEDAREMKKKIASLGLSTADTQIFTPTPGSLATAMYVAGHSPAGDYIPVEKDVKNLQKRKSLLAK